MKYGVSINIDVSKINKDRLIKGEKGTYLDSTVFIDLDNTDKYGNNGMITQNWKDAEKGKTPILGNVKVFWNEQNGSVRSQVDNSVSQPQGGDTFSDDIPFAPLRGHL